MTYWACARTETHHEPIAQRHLERQGFEVYFPRIRTALHIRDRRGRTPLTHRTEPLFRSYLFVRIVEQWHAIRWTIGITQVLLNGERPAVIGDPYIDELRAREGPDGLVRLPQARPEFCRGDRIRIVDGVFQGQFALFEGMKPKQRVEILLALLGGERRIELDRHAIARA